MTAAALIGTIVFSLWSVGYAQAGDLRWASTAANRPTAATDADANPLRPSMRRDAQLMSAVWETDDVAAVQQASDEHRSIVVERSSPVYGAPADNSATGYDPFDEHDRLAQLPSDPFEDPFDEPDPDVMDGQEFDDQQVDEIDDVEAAVEQEIERRRATDNLIEDSTQELLEPEIPDVDALEDEMDPTEELGDEDRLSDDPEDEERLQSEDEDWTTPDFDVVPADEAELTPEELQQRSEEKQREREESEENCREEIEKLEADPISSIDLSIRVPGNAGEDFPYECSVSKSRHEPRQWPQITYNWKASAICHKPLYFEQVQLERYGHSWGPYVQPIMSGVHFFSTVPILPYKMGIRTPNECVYTLGYYRPGSCAPYMIDPVPFTWRAAMFEGAVATGIPFIIP